MISQKRALSVRLSMSVCVCVCSFLSVEVIACISHKQVLAPATGCRMSALFVPTLPLFFPVMKRADEIAQREI